MLFRKKKNPEPPPTTRSERRPDGRLHYALGKRGSGKTTWVRKKVRPARRLLVWDGKEEWGERDGCKVVTSPHELRALILRPGPMRISYRVPVSRAAFEVFCRLAWVWARFEPGVLVVEELADVTTPAKAPDAWGEISRKGRGYGLDAYVLTQRPQEVDKTVQGNTDVFHCGQMADSVDQEYIARRCLGGVDVKLVQALRPMQFIERDVSSGRITTGTTRHNSRK